VARSAFGYMHVVDWSTVHKIRALIRQKAAYEEAVEVEGGPQTTTEELSRCWLQILKEAHPTAALTDRDKEFVRIRVMQTMREVDPQSTGMVGIDIWCNHMLLTRSSPSAMRAMLHINRLLEGAMLVCPSILVALQHSFEVAEGFPEWTFQAPPTSLSDPGSPSRRDPEVAPEEDLDFQVPVRTRAPTEDGLAGPLSTEEVMNLFSRKLWPFRPIPKEGATKRRTDFSYRTPEEFVQECLIALELDGSHRIASTDFLALCLGRQEWPVTLHLYDLSRGLATMLGPMLFSQELEGVWHTGIVVFGKEYYFGGDIFYDHPGHTGFGTPRVVVPLGTTLRQRDELHAFIVDDLKPVFNREAYDAARNNCNHFTDRVSMYLVGRHIPEEILDQPQLMLDTNLGRALRPLLNRVLGRRFEAPSSAEEISALGGSAPQPLQGKLGSRQEMDEALWGQTLQL